MVAEVPATTIVSVGSFTSTPGTTPTVAAQASTGGGSSGLSTGAKAGIGAGVGILVLAVAIFGGWYSWYMRRRRRRDSMDNSDRYTASSMPSMGEYGGAIGGSAAAAGLGGLGAAAAYSDRSDRRSELPSPPLARSPPPRSPDRLLPGAAAIRSWNSASPPPQQGSSHLSVSDQSEYSQGGGTNQHQGAGAYFANLNELPDDQRNIHQLPDDQVNPGGAHQRHLSGGSAGFSSYQPDGYQSGPVSNQDSYELPSGSPPSSYRGTDREVPLHQRSPSDRVPIRPGHFSPSHNF